MKISIENLEVHYKFGDEKGFEMIKNAGFDCVDYSYYWLQNFASEVLGDGYIDYAKKCVKNLMKSDLFAIKPMLHLI